MTLAGAGGGARSVSDLGENGVLPRRDDQENRQIRCLPTPRRKVKVCNALGQYIPNILCNFYRMFSLSIYIPPEMLQHNPDPYTVNVCGYRSTLTYFTQSASFLICPFLAGIE